MQRRQFLKVTASSAVMLGGGLTIWAAPRASSARAPWKDAGHYEDPMRFALSHAILAPNPHNRQPWIVELLGPNEAILYCDPDRHLPVTDPFDRQITIGLGCFLELFSLAAQEKQKQAIFTLFPEGAHDKQLDNKPVAHIKLINVTNAANNTDLFRHIHNRRTDRTAYSDQVPSQTDLQAITAAANSTENSTGAGFTNAPVLTARIKEICTSAARIEFMTPHTHEESAGLMRVGRKAVKQNPDGISIEGPMIQLLGLTGSLSPKAMRDHNSAAFKQGLDMYLRAVQTAAGFIWIPSPGNSREDQITAGRAYVLAHLKATQLGLSMHPLSQALQEYAELGQQVLDIHDLLQIKAPRRLQMLVRIGYGKEQRQAPRWPLETRIRKLG